MIRTGRPAMLMIERSGLITADVYPATGVDGLTPRAAIAADAVAKCRVGGNGYDPALASTVTARRFWFQQVASLHTATGRSLP